MTIDLAAIEQLLVDIAEYNEYEDTAELPGVVRSLLAHIRTLEAEAARLREALDDLTDNNSCEFSRYGNCLTHGMTAPCPHDTARKLLPSRAAVLAQGGQE